MAIAGNGGRLDASAIRCVDSTNNLPIAIRMPHHWLARCRRETGEEMLSWGLNQEEILVANATSGHFLPSGEVNNYARSLMW